MRLPCVRFTVGTLLFGVAAVAANFWGFRRFYETQVYTGGSIGYRILPAGVGVLPLFNVVLIGAWFFVAKRLRPPRHGRAANPRSSLLGVAYFSLHFLLLGSLVSLLMPDVIQRLQVVLDAVTEYTAERWGAVFGEPGGTMPWIILDSLVLGVIVSGPPLLFSWIGHVLATRCATTLSRRRFRVMTCLVSLGFASAALAVCMTPQRCEDEQDVALDFEVVDEVSGRPITSAFVCITDPFSRDSLAVPPRALTDNEGRARLTGRFVVHGERNAFRTMGHFSSWGRWLEVSAAGHGTRRIPLTAVLGQFTDPVRPNSHKVALARGEARVDSFRDLAGIYTDGGRGFGGRWFEIEPDGRFAWCEWGCVPPGSQEYGYLKRRDRTIELVPVPHPGRDIDPQVTITYRAIEWGARLYLSSMDQHELREFCRVALTSNRQSNSAYIYGSYLRETDRDKPRTGLPRLPMKVWAMFLSDEVNLNDEESSLRLALDSLIARHRRERRSTTEGRQR